MANDTGTDKLQFSGFATLGAVYSDSDTYGYRKSVASDNAVYSDNIDFKQHTLLGLQANWTISSHFDAVYQSVLRDVPEPSFSEYTTLAFLRYEVNANWSVRLGRTALDIFLLTEYRDIDFSYPWATAPNEVYGMIPYRYIDGGDITYNQRGLGGIFKTKLFAGSSEGNIYASSVIIPVNLKDIIGMSLSFDHFNWVINAKYTQVKFANEFPYSTLSAEYINQVPEFLWPNAQDFAQSVLVEGKKLNYASVSGQYQWRNWLASTELSRISSESDVIPTITSGYAALSYQLSAHQFYSIYAISHSETYKFNEQGVNEQVLEELIDGVTNLMNAYSTNQQTLSFGWRWDICANVASSLQWNYTSLEGTDNILWKDKPEHNKAPEKINTIQLTLSTVF